MAPEGSRNYISAMAFRIEHRLGIPASPLAIWDVLGEVERWPQWQALYPSVKGVLRIGGTLDLQEQLPGTEARPLSASGLVVERLVRCHCPSRIRMRAWRRLTVWSCSCTWR